MATTKSRLFDTSIDIPAEKREGLVALLSQTLADISDLTSQVHVAHWNVKGKDFYQLHLLFDEMYGELGALTDKVAERLTTLGGYAHGTVRDAAENSTLPEYPSDIINGMDHVKALAERYAHFAAHVRRRSSSRTSTTIPRPLTSILKCLAPSTCGSGSSRPTSRASKRPGPFCSSAFVGQASACRLSRFEEDGRLKPALLENETALSKRRSGITGFSRKIRCLGGRGKVFVPRSGSRRCRPGHDEPSPGHPGYSFSQEMPFPDSLLTTVAIFVVDQPPENRGGTDFQCSSPKFPWGLIIGHWTSARPTR